MATAPAGWGSEVGMQMGTASEKGRWIHMLYRQTGAKGELFLDGVRVQVNSSMPVFSEIFTNITIYNWGRTVTASDVPEDLFSDL
ncbi:MAG: hypothetical protein J6035_01495 [Bacteroidaceae bacterium]|nr:hypothetical protein [Bacteroidaceae bacterium]